LILPKTIRLEDYTEKGSTNHYENCHGQIPGDSLIGTDKSACRKLLWWVAHPLNDLDEGAPRLAFETWDHVAARSLRTAVRGDSISTVPSSPIQ
jgi:hypothetical protein